MISWYAWLIIIAAGIGLSVRIFLWFRNVSRIMLEQKNMMDNAASQLAAVRSQETNRYDPELAANIKRAEINYRQAETLYRQTIRKPKNRLPARLMGYRPIPRADYYTLGKRNWVE